MKKLHSKLKVLLDAGVPVSVGRKFEDAGHQVIFYQEVLAEKAPDEVVCTVAIENKAILIAIDADMKQFSKRYGKPDAAEGRFKNLNVIRLCCNEVMSSKRVEQSMSLIEHEWAYSAKKHARRLWLDIAAHNIRTHR
ncbi:hypothetical protein E1180_05390 [Roseibium denhamense]|uniref:DUF5615 family PIN-like protein n=1 Tax=Roseibium denhamense TaxID=76305 RepID=UPI0012BB9871|nr:DUF5615 family PIN-like protein [Roseibium denhamense]MTI04947.1 hypothetical protein [Roseibium denhamense]